jgi:hypothetical protein
MAEQYADARELLTIFDRFAVTPDGVWIAASQTVYVGTLS